MIEAYSVNKEDNVLLVGEGNFSFSKDFLNLINKTSKNEFCGMKVVTTCRESQFETFSEFKKQNIKYLCDLGVSVIFNVDATKLKFVPLLQNKKFTKVIFNFPHVGGKMKIHLNRKLLKDFFSSACDVLENNGCIVVALCDGQGGTEADKKTRRWDDAWQVTEMAAQSDLILHKVEPFDIKCFPQYVNNGFRSGEKSFHCNDAVVHIFKKQNLPHILQDCSDRWLKDGKISDDLVFEFLEERMVNPILNPKSASSYIYNILEKKLGVHFYIYTSVLNYNMTVNSNCKTEPKSCSVNQLNACQQIGTDIYQALDEKHISNNIITKVLVKKVTINDFSIAPVKFKTVVFGVKSYISFFLEFVSQILLSFSCEWQIEFKEICKEYQCVCILNTSGEHYKSINIVEVVVLKNGIVCHICHIDELAQVLFKLDDWRSLWNGSIDFSHSDRPTFCPVSLYPRAFSFDLGLSVPLNFKDNFEEKLFLCLWLLAGDIITKTELLTTYLPSDRDLICFCYRITYKSFNAPFHRKRVIHIHEKIIAHHVAKFLKINIT